MVASAAVATTRPAQTPLVPALVRNAEELTAVNALTGWIESASVVASSAATGLLLTLAGPGLVFAVAGAAGLVSVGLAAGEVLIREGEPGDRFYAIADGRLDVTIGGAPVATNVRGDGIGEIALLYSVPRTATVTAVSPATVLALSREDFLTAVAGHMPTGRAAAAVADERLDQDRRPTNCLWTPPPSLFERGSRGCRSLVSRGRNPPSPACWPLAGANIAATDVLHCRLTSC